LKITDINNEQLYRDKKIAVNCMQCQLEISKKNPSCVIHLLIPSSNLNPKTFLIAIKEKQSHYIYGNCQIKFQLPFVRQTNTFPKNYLIS